MAESSAWSVVVGSASSAPSDPGMFLRKQNETANDMSFNSGVGPADLSLVAANQFNSLCLVFCSRIVKFSLEWYKWMMEAKRRNMLEVFFWSIRVDSNLVAGDERRSIRAEKNQETKHRGSRPSDPS